VVIDECILPMCSVTAFVEGWDFVQTLGEGAYGEYVNWDLNTYFSCIVSRKK